MSVTIPTLASGSRVQVLRIAESSYGNLPSTPSMTRLRVTGEGLEQMAAAMKSAELRPDRFLADWRQGIHKITGDLDYEMSYGNFDDILASALWGSWETTTVPQHLWASQVPVASEAVGTTAGSVTPITHTMAAVPVVPGSVTITDTGDELTLTDTDNGDGTGAFAATGTHASYFTSGTINYFTGAVSLIFTTSATGGSLVGYYRQLNVLRQPFSFEIGFVDIGQYILYAGCLPDTMSAEFKPGSIVKGKIGMLGIGPATPSSSSNASAIIQPNANGVFDSLSGTIKLAGSTVAYLTGLTLDIKNNLEPAEVIGQKSILGAFIGTLDVTGTVTAYFPDVTLLNYWWNETTFKIDGLFAGTPSTSTLEFILPAAKFTKGASPATSPKGVVLTLPFIAKADDAFSSPPTHTMIEVIRTHA